MNKETEERNRKCQEETDRVTGYIKKHTPIEKFIGCVFGLVILIIVVGSVAGAILLVRALTQ